MRVCLHGGEVVGAREWLPSAPFDVRTAVFVRPHQGCNALRCGRCGATIRQVPGLTADPTVDPADVFLAPDPATVPGIASSGTGRLYACGCHLHVEHLAEDLEPPGGEPTRVGGAAAWRCGGHPPIDLPGQLDGDEVGPGADVEALVGRRAAAPGTALPDGLTDGDLDTPAFWLLRLQRLLTEAGRPDLGDRVAAAAADLLGDPDPVVRLTTTTFFNAQPAVPAAAALAGVPDDAGGPAEFGGKTWDVGLQVRAALAARVRATDAAGTLTDADLAALQRHATRRGGADRAVVRLLTQLDPGWVAEHAVEVATAGPEHAGAVLVASRALPTDRLVATASAIAAVPGVDRTVLLRAVDDLPAGAAAAVRARLGGA